jgi:uncharacterized RmlC-like cupin family protein
MRAKIIFPIAFGLLVLPAAADPTVIGEKNGKDIVTVRVRANEQTQSKQAVPMFTGISGNTAGAKGLTLLKVVIPRGGSAQPHGRVETRYGNNLEKSVVNVAGDFLFIPPDVPHQPFNLSSTEPAIAIVARNDTNEQEHVILYPKQK